MHDVLAQLLRNTNKQDYTAAAAVAESFSTSCRPMQAAHQLCSTACVHAPLELITLAYALASQLVTRSTCVHLSAPTLLTTQTTLTTTTFVHFPRLQKTTIARQKVLHTEQAVWCRSHQACMQQAHCPASRQRVLSNTVFQPTSMHNLCSC